MDVHQHQVRLKLADQPDGFLAFPGGADHLIAQRLQLLLDIAGHHHFVFDNEDCVFLGTAVHGQLIINDE